MRGRHHHCTFYKDSYSPSFSLVPTSKSPAFPESCISNEAWRLRSPLGSTWSSCPFPYTIVNKNAFHNAISGFNRPVVFSVRKTHVLYTRNNPNSEANEYMIVLPMFIAPEFPSDDGETDEGLFEPAGAGSMHSSPSMTEVFPARQMRQDFAFLVFEMVPGKQSVHAPLLLGWVARLFCVNFVPLKDPFVPGRHHGVVMNAVPSVRQVLLHTTPGLWSAVF